MMQPQQLYQNSVGGTSIPNAPLPPPFPSDLSMMMLGDNASAPGGGYGASPMARLSMPGIGMTQMGGGQQPIDFSGNGSMTMPPMMPFQQQRPQDPYQQQQQAQQMGLLDLQQQQQPPWGALDPAAAEASLALGLNAVEAPFYQDLWRVAEPTGSGSLSGPQGAEFLRLSGLPRPILHEIWNIADTRNEGALGIKEFFVACRLVAHAQNGLPATPEAVIMVPPSLPNFELSTPHSYSESSSYVGGPEGVPNPLGSAFNPSGMPGGAYGGSGGGDPTGTPSGRSGMNSVWSDVGASPSREYQSFAISEEDKSKYSAIFRKTDTDFDGFVTGDDAKIVMHKSGLPESDLARIWALADRDADGRLNLEEFLVAFHLISRRRYGVSIPDSLPHELEAIFHKPQSGFPTPPGSTSSTLPPPPALDGWGDGSPPAAAAIIPPPPELKSSNDDPFADFQAEGKQKSTKSRKAKRPSSSGDDADDGALSFGDLVSTETKRKSKDRKGADNEGSESDSPSDAFRGREDRKPSKFERRRRKNSQEDLEITRQFDESIERIENEKNAERVLKDAIHVDRQLARKAAKAVDRVADELGDLKDVNTALKAELVKAKKELKRQLERRQEFEVKVTEVKIELEAIQEERRSVNLDHISVLRDLDHYQNEILFLRQQIEETKQDIAILLDSNSALDKQLKSTEQQGRQLDSARRDVLERIGSEKQQLKTQEAEIAEMKVALASLRREKEGVQAKHSLLHEKLRQADQDRNLLLHSVETERARLGEMQEQRLEGAAEKTSLAKLLAETDQDWIRVAGQGDEVVLDMQSPPRSLRSSLGPIQEVSATGRLPRDAKGVPSGAMAAPLIPVYPLGVSGRNSHLSQRFSSVGHPTSWMSFGQSGSNGPPARQPFGTEDLAKFHSVGGSVTADRYRSNAGGGLRSLRERRGIEGIARELGLDSGGGRLDAEFASQSEANYLPSRKDERLNFSSASRSRQFRSRNDSTDDEQFGGKSNSVKGDDTDHGRRKGITKKGKKGSRSSSKGKNGESDAKLTSDKKGSKGGNNKDEDDLFEGSWKRFGGSGETPSFGARSLNQSNSVAS